MPNIVNIAVNPKSSTCNNAANNAQKIEIIEQGKRKRMCFVPVCPSTGYPFLTEPIGPPVEEILYFPNSRRGHMDAGTSH